MVGDNLEYNKDPGKDTGIRYTGTTEKLNVCRCRVGTDA